MDFQVPPCLVIWMPKCFVVHPLSWEVFISHTFQKSPLRLQISAYAIPKQNGQGCLPDESGPNHRLTTLCNNYPQWHLHSQTYIQGIQPQPAQDHAVSQLQWFDIELPRSAIYTLQLYSSVEPSSPKWHEAWPWGHLRPPKPTNIRRYNIPTMYIHYCHSASQATEAMGLENLHWHSLSTPHQEIPHLLWPEQRWKLPDSS